MRTGCIGIVWRRWLLWRRSGAAGCLVKETTHRLYLSPSGAVAWAVLEESVQIERKRPCQAHDAKSRSGSRGRDAIRIPSPRVCAGWARTGGSTSLLRPARPYMALTDARFARVDRVIARLFEELGLRGEATLDGRPAGDDAAVALDLSSLDDPGAEHESPVTALLEDLDRYRLVLTDGRFVVGHRLSNPGRRGRAAADAARRSLSRVRAQVRGKLAGRRTETD